MSATLTRVIYGLISFNMKISYNWLQEYFDEKLPAPEHVGAMITMHSFEVDSLETVGTDTVFDFKILPDRAHDCMSHYGIAAEIGMLFDLYPKELAIDAKTTKDFSSHNLVTVTLDDESRCRRATKRVIKNIKVGESPLWLKERLAAIGQRSINNVVDIANFVMFETGQPVHTFDFDKVAGDTKHITIRAAKPGETLKALDGKDYTLDETMLVIADEKEALDIAGIKGGMASGIDEKTTTVMLSVCSFEPTMIRKTRTKLGLKTDASDRFEKGLSPDLVKTALLRLSFLLQRVAGGELSEDFVDVYPQPVEMRHIILSLEYVNSLLGITLSEEGIEGMFRKLGFGTEKIDHSIYRVAVPTNRLDMNLPCDVAEEIIRIMGYDRLTPIDNPHFAENSITNTLFLETTAARKKLLNEGYSEICTSSFSAKGEVEVLASASNKKYLRANLTDGLKESIALNQTNLALLGVDTVKVFEIGAVFTKDGEALHVAYGDKKKVTEVAFETFMKDVDVSAIDTSTSMLSRTSRFKPWSLYPFIVRDIALWVPEQVQSDEIKTVLEENATELLVQEPRLFDEFSKDGKKSYAFRLVFQSFERTLTDDEVNKIMEGITGEIKKHPDWTIR